MKIHQRWSRFNRSLAGKPRVATIRIRLSKEELATLKRAARACGQTLNEFINTLLRMEIDRYEKLSAMESHR